MSFYIFKNTKCISVCDFPPNVDDLSSRGEIAIESDIVEDINNIALIEGVIEIKPYTPTTEELIVTIREERNRRLIESDWTDTLSAQQRLGIEKYNEWQEYRQKLRDLPISCDPYNIIFPIKPL